MGATYEANLVYANADDGIKHEISFDAVIRNNTACGNGARKDEWLWGSDILVQNSRSVLVANNTVVVSGEGGNGIGLIQQSRGNGTGPGYGPHLTLNNSVVGNRIVFLTSHGRLGGVADFEAVPFFRRGGNTFEANQYLVAPGDAAPSAIASARQSGAAAAAAHLSVGSTLSIIPISRLASGSRPLRKGKWSTFLMRRLSVSSVSPRKGGQLCSTSYAKQPSAHRSTSGPTYGSLDADTSSGAM